MSSDRQQMAPPKSTSDCKIRSDSTKKEDHLRRQNFKQNSFSFLPLVLATVNRTADYLVALGKEQKSFLKQSQGPPATPVVESVIWRNMTSMQLILVELHGRLFAVSSFAADMEKDENLPRTPIQGIKNFRKNDALFSFKMLKNRG